MLHIPYNPQQKVDTSNAQSAGSAFAMFNGFKSTVDRIAEFGNEQKNRLSRALYGSPSADVDQAPKEPTLTEDSDLDVDITDAVQVPDASDITKDQQNEVEADEDDDDKDDDEEDDDESDDDESADDEGEEHDRRDCEAIRAIPDSKIEAAVLDILNLTDESKDFTCHVTNHKEGSFNFVAELTIMAPNKPSKDIVIKIPFHGTPTEWTFDDGEQFKREAILMLYIQQKTQVPLPEVLHYNETCDNAIGAPYIIMTKLQGQHAGDIWYGKPAEDFGERELHLLADSPSAEVEKKRITFLRSLAEAMAQLNTLEFNKIGVPSFYMADPLKPKICWGSKPALHWHTKTKLHEPYHVGPFKTSKDFFLNKVKEIPNWKHYSTLEVSESTSKTDLAQFGFWKILDMIYSSPVFTHSAKPTTEDDKDSKESFVLRHDDLSLYNILCAEDGTVTGILDWDGLMAVPRCIGATSMPPFLSRDWLPDYLWRGEPVAVCDLEHYRTVYADAMARYSGDRRYTRKSPIYQAAYALIYEDEDQTDLVKKLLMEIPELRRADFDTDAFYWRIGAGYPAAEKLIKEKISQLLFPDV